MDILKIWDFQTEEEWLFAHRPGCDAREEFLKWVRSRPFWSKEADKTDEYVIRNCHYQWKLVALQEVK
jgi:hypothetical protein